MSGSVVPLAMFSNIKLRVAISPVFDFAGDPLDGCVAGQCTQDTASDNSISVHVVFLGLDLTI